MAAEEQTSESSEPVFTSRRKERIQSELFIPKDTLHQPWDVVLMVKDGKQFKAHRRVLSAACPFFEKLLNSDMKETQEKCCGVCYGDFPAFSARSICLKTAKLRRLFSPQPLSSSSCMTCFNSYHKVYLAGLSWTILSHVSTSITWPIDINMTNIAWLISHYQYQRATLCKDVSLWIDY